MQVLHQCCCGLDVHKRFVVACLIRQTEEGTPHKELRRFDTLTPELLRLVDWLQSAGCTHVALESTGVYWKPIFNLMEGLFEIVLVNAQHMKAVPGRKTDAKDAEWIADLLQHGLLKASFIPPQPQRDLRDLTTDARPMQHQLKQLCGLGLVRLFTWEGNGPCPWRESERYELSEAALRFLAMRHGVPPAHYLYPVTEEPDRRKISPLDPTLRWVQRGIEGLRAQMSHTNELYRCIRHIVAVGRRTGSYAIVFWKSARESVRSYHDSSERYSGRPDAELLYTLPGSTVVCHLLIEYDRGTTFAREYQDKFAAYSDYQHDMRTVLPRIVMITPNQQASDRIRRSIRQVHAQDVQVTIVLEQDVLERGLLPVLGVQGPPQGSEET